MTIIDAHTHIENITNDCAPLYRLADRLGYSKLTVHSLQCTGDLLQNVSCGLCKALHSDRTYAFAGLDYVTGKDFAQQAMDLRAMGFDGMKMLEGKPTTRSQLGNALDDPKYDSYYDYLEETGFPVLFHVVDPPEFWDQEKVPGWAVEQGWFYDETHVPYEQYYDEVERMLDKHPKLRAIFAHFYFLSGDPIRLQKFLDDHPSVAVDVTAGIEMYHNFTKDPALWRAFFVKNSHRIIFGTDSTDAPGRLDNPAEGERDITGYAALEIEFLRSDKEIVMYGEQYRGLGLPEDVQRRVFAENFCEYAGKAPQRLNIDALIREAESTKRFLTKEEEIRTLDYIIERFKGIL